MKSSHYAQALYGSLKDVSGADRERRFANFISLIEHNAHRYLLPDIVRQLRVLWKEDIRKKRVEITTANNVSPERRKEILSDARYQSVLGGSDRIIEWKTDPTLIGGIRIRSRDRLFDGSYKMRLLELYTTLTRASSNV